MKNWDMDLVALISIVVGLPFIVGAFILIGITIDENYHLKFMKICAHEGLQYKYDNDRLICVK